MLLALLFSPSAHAAPMLHVEGVTTLATLGDDARDLGSGLGMRLGWSFDALIAEVTPEVGVTVWAADALSVVPEAGARLALGKGVEPGAYAHVAYLPLEGGGSVGWDAGLGLDVTLIPKIDFGVQVGVIAFDATPTATGGVNVGFKLK